MTEKTLRLNFHGGLIDQLGSQTYQSHVAAFAEIISNAWDADAEEVRIDIPIHINEDSVITIVDNGIGMTFDECQDRYLTVGAHRRELPGGEKSPEKNRPILGRKGIGKFAGFGIGNVMEIESISKRTGERTVFLLDNNKLSQGAYIAETEASIPVIVYEPPNGERKSEHGTTIRLRELTLGRSISLSSFSRSMSRRFLLHQQVADFAVLINGSPLPEESLEGVEFNFPRDYTETERPEGLEFEGDWGVETLPGGRQVKWRFWFYKDTIGEEELRGIAVFSRGKLAQKPPFFFNISGGVMGQHAVSYMSGQVQADFIDDLEKDIIAPERQRIDWGNGDVRSLEAWGQKRVRKALDTWRYRRGEKRVQQIEDKVTRFSSRLDKLAPHERETVEKALTNLGSIETLKDEQFESLAEAILTAWESGRLQNLIHALSKEENATPGELLSLLTEAEVLVALNIAEVVKAKLEAINGLRILVDQRKIENEVRDYIAERPYLLSPKWETFRIEKSMNRILEEAAIKAGLIETITSDGGKRLDLALKSNDTLLVVEFMRPGKTLDWDHISRCERYITIIREVFRNETGWGISRVMGLIVADNLDKHSEVSEKLKKMRSDEIFAYSWQSLLDEAEAGLKEYMEIIRMRSPDDERITGLAAEAPGKIPVAEASGDTQ